MYVNYVYKLGPSARFARAPAYRIILRNDNTELSCGMALLNYSADFKYDMMSPNYITRLCYRIWSRDLIMELYYGMLLQKCIAELCYGITLQSYITGLYRGIILQDYRKESDFPKLGLRSRALTFFLIINYLSTCVKRCPFAKLCPRYLNSQIYKE